MRHSVESLILNRDELSKAELKRQRRAKRYCYYEIFSASTMTAKAEKLIDFLARVDVDIHHDSEQIYKALFQKQCRIHITVGEVIVKSIDEIIISSVDENNRDLEKLNKYLNVLNKLSIFFSTNPLFLDQIFDEIKRVISNETIVLIINALSDEIKLALINKLLQVPYWRDSIPQLEIYSTFS